jgi:hypothetical protein
MRVFVVYVERGQYPDYLMRIIGVTKTKEKAEEFVVRCKHLDKVEFADKREMYWERKRYTIEEFEMDTGRWALHLWNFHVDNDDQNVVLLCEESSD